MQSSQSGLASIREWWEVGAAIVVGIASAGVTWARLTSRMNGLGRRVREVESDLGKQDERMDLIEREQARATDDRQRLHEQVGAAVRAAEESKEASELARVAIVGAVHTMELEIVKEMGALRVSMSERMTAVETMVGLMNTPRTRRTQ